MMVYDMQTNSEKEIDIGECIPVQFQAREDGEIGIWGTNDENGMFCFWSDEKITYVPDEDVNRGWTNLCDYNERGIILEREYPTSSLQGTKIYQVPESGEVTVLASEGDMSCTANEIPSGYLLFADDFVLAVDSSSGQVDVYDYEFSYIENLVWNIDIKENMIFKGCCVWNDKIIGLWKSKDGDTLEISEGMNPKITSYIL